MARAASRVCILTAVLFSNDAASSAKTLRGPALTNALKRSGSVPALIEQHSMHRQSFNEISLSAFWTRFGLLGSKWSADESAAEIALSAIVQDTLDKISSDPEDVHCYKCRQLTSTAHGLAKSGYGHLKATRPLWDRIQGATLEQIATYSPREIATTAWSFAKVGLGQTYRDLFRALELEAFTTLASYTTQGLANLAWAFAKASVPQHYSVHW